MMEIILSNKMIARVDDADYEKIKHHAWHASQEGRKGKKWYAVRFTRVRDNHEGYGKKTKVRMHRELCGLPPWLFDDTKSVVDHKDGDGLNNQRKDNLRVMTQLQNMQYAPNWGKKKVVEPWL